MAGETRDLTNRDDSRKVRVKIDNVQKVFSGRNGDMVALNGVTMDIHDNEFVCVVGPSGCGKSTLLNIIAGLSSPTSGKVLCDGKEVKGTGTERGVVFQQYALFPWLTVKKNVMFALEMRGVLIATGSACAANKGTRSHVLTAIDLAPEVADGSLRITLGHLSDEANTAQATDIIIEEIKKEYSRSTK